MSSMRHITPGSPARVQFISLWKCSGALDMPKGSLLKQNRPNGVMNVVSSRKPVASGVCQNSQLASSLENVVALVSWSRISSILGNE